MSLILNGTTGISDVDGTAAAPALTGTDSNTGIFFPAADTVAISTGGTQRTVVDSSGNVGIGTSSPAVNLHVANAGTTGQLNYVLQVQKTAVADANSSAVGILLAVEASNFGKGALAFERTGGFGVGTLHLLNRNTFDTVNPTLADSKLAIDSSGNLLVGTTSALSQAGRATFVGTGNALVTQVSNGSTAYQSTNASGTSAYFAAIWSNNGNSFSTCGTIQVSGSNTSYNTSSDYRLKEDVQPMTGALAKVARLKPVTYKWKSDGTDSEGFIAHELAEICPHAVSGEKDALKEDGSIMPQGIDTSFLVATLTAAIQEQQALITALTTRITALEAI